MSKTVNEALAQAEFRSDGQVYRFVKLPANGITVAAGIVAESGNPFAALIVDKDEVTLMVPDDVFDRFEKRLIDHVVSDIRYRLITLDVELEPTLIGFMAAVSRALAAANISIMPYAAFSRDHLLVPKNDFDRAIMTLEELKTTKQAPSNL